MDFYLTRKGMFFFLISIILSIIGLNLGTPVLWIPMILNLLYFSFLVGFNDKYFIEKTDIKAVLPRSSVRLGEIAEINLGGREAGILEMRGLQQLRSIVVLSATDVRDHPPVKHIQGQLRVEPGIGLRRVR